jgi:hypothetical protein
MKFLSIYRPDEKTSGGGPPTKEHMAEMGKLIEESMKAGTLLATADFCRSQREARVSDALEVTSRLWMDLSPRPKN